MLEEFAPLPTFGSRAGAWLLDLAIIGVLAGISAVGWSLRHYSQGGLPPAHGKAVLGVILGVTGLAGAILYLPICEGSARGQTLGKHFLGLRVVRVQDGGPLTLAHGFGRFLARVADVYSVGLLWAAVDTYGRAFHDHLAGTVVIDAGPVPAVAPRTECA